MDMNTAHDHKVCCFCDNELSLDSRVCYTCHEYKGVMTVEAFEDYLKVTYDCDCLSDLDDKVSA
jgi:hypothetical protein